MILLNGKKPQQKSSQPCNFCSKNNTVMIEKALYDRYSSSQNFYYSKQINQLINDDLTKATVDFMQWQVIDDQDQFLKRQYKISEYLGKSKSLGDYYQYHRQLPRFFGLPIQIAMKRHHQKVRDHEYKVVKRMMNQTEQSLMDPSMIPSQNSNSVSELSNVLKLLQPSEIKIEQSVAFFHVVQELKELTKNQVATFDIKGDFYKTNNPRNFQQYLQKISKRKRKGISIQSVDKKHLVHKTEQGFQIFNKNLQQEQEKLIMKNYQNDTSKYKGKLSQRVDTLLNGLQKTKPLLKNTIIPQIIPKLNKIQRQRSIERIYGADRYSYNSLSNKLSTKVITLSSDRLKGSQRFRISQSTKKLKDKQVTQIKAVNYRSSNKSLDKKPFKQKSREEQKDMVINITQRKQISQPKFILKKKSQSVPTIKTARSSKEMQGRNKKLDPIKIFKRVRGLA